MHGADRHTEKKEKEVRKRGGAFTVAKKKKNLQSVSQSYGWICADIPLKGKTRVHRRSTQEMWGK